MPKKGGKGGKKKRKSKNEEFVSKLIYREDDQYYAVITKMLGDGRVLLKYINQKNRLVETMGIIRGKMRKRVWINIGNVVLISERDYEKDKVDIIHKYSDRNVHSLKRDGEINNTLLDCLNEWGDDKSKTKSKTHEDDSIKFEFEENEYEKEYTEDTKNIQETSISSTLVDIDAMNSINETEFNWDEI